MKKLDHGVRSPKFKLRNAISMSLATITLAATCQIGMAQISDNANSSAPQIQGMNLSTKIPNQYIVVLKENTVNDSAVQRVDANFSLAEARAAVVQDIGVELATQSRGALKQTYSSAINGFVVESQSVKHIESLLKDPRVDYIEADQVITIGATQNNATWGLDRIDQANLPLNNTYSYDYDGTGVNAYVIDTGVRITHNQFGNRGRSGYTAINDGNGTNDCQGHGTHVAGTIGSTTYGVAKDARIYAVRVLG